MTSRTSHHLQSFSALDNGQTEAQISMDASIQGINDSYFTMLLFCVISLMLSFFIKRVEQASEENEEKTVSNENA